MLATLCMVGPTEGTRTQCLEFSPHLCVYLFVPFGPYIADGIQRGGHCETHATLLTHTPINNC